MIIVKGMTMPKSCEFCPISHWNKFDQLTGCELGPKHIRKDDEDFWENPRPSWCPLADIKETGRLIDADDLLERLENLLKRREKDEAYNGSRGARVSWNDAIAEIKKSPTITGEKEAEE